MLPRLYQHFSSVVPNGGHGTTAPGLADHPTPYNPSSRKVRGQWVHLDGYSSSRDLSEPHRQERSGSEEQALEDAVEGC